MLTVPEPVVRLDTLPEEILRRILRLLLQLASFSTSDVFARDIKHPIDISFPFPEHVLSEDLHIPGLPVLRLNKRFHAMASEILYGEHIFFMRHLDTSEMSFFRKIGTFHAARLRRLIIALENVSSLTSKSSGRELSEMMPGLLPGLKHLTIEQVYFPQSGFRSSQRLFHLRWADFHRLLVVGAVAATSQAHKLNRLSFFSEEGSRVWPGLFCGYMNVSLVHNGQRKVEKEVCIFLDPEPKYKTKKRFGGRRARSLRSAPT